MKPTVIKESSKISYIFKNGVKYESKYFMLFFMQADQCEFAAIAPKKTFRKAVDRNFVKRRIRALARNSINKPGSYIIMARKRFYTANFKVLENEFVAKIDNISYPN